MNRHGRQSAFTLLELILAMSVTCMLALALYATLRTALKARDSAQAAVEPARAVQVALDLIGRDLESALPLGGTLAGPFLGEHGGNSTASDTLEFYAVGSGNDAEDPTRCDGIKKIELGVEELEDGSQALVRKVTHNLLAQQVPEPDEEVLCRDVASFSLRYFANDAWSDTWDSSAQGSLPAAVEVTLELGRSGPGAQPNYRLQRTFTLACNSTGDTTGGTQ